MPVLTLSSLRTRDAGRRRPLRVVALCAAWCDTCNQFREVFERIAATHRDACFVWLDIEDDSEICGDVDVENFPTLAIFRMETPLHFGVSLPHEASVVRLVDEMAERATSVGDAPASVLELGRRLRDYLG